MNVPEEITKATLQSLFGEDDSDDDENNDHIEISIHSPFLSEKTPRVSSSPSRSSCTRKDKVTEKDRFRKDALAKTRKRKSSFQQLQKQQKDQKPISSNKCERNHRDSITSNSATSWSQKIGIFDGVLEQDECDELIAVHSSQAHAGYIDHIEVTRVMDLVERVNESTTCVSSIGLALPLLRARYKTWEKIEEFYPYAALDIFPSFTAITAWHSGAFLRMHYDSNRSYLQERHYSALLYLNDPSDDVSGEDSNPPSHPCNYHRNGFSGGDLVFEVPTFSKNAENIKKSKTATTKRIRPKAGRLVCFPSSSDYVHAVEEVTKGTRYALTMWFTKDQNYSEKLEALQMAYSSLHSKTRRALPPQLFQQPWETPEQASSLSLRNLTRAGLPKPNCDHEANDSIGSWNVTQIELLHLIAHCWWKRGIPLGDLLGSATIQQDDKAESSNVENYITNTIGATKRHKVWTLEGGKEFSTVFRDWKEDYLPRRSRGLTSAMERWTNREGGLISSVRDGEME